MLSDEEMKAIEDLKDMIEKSKDLMEEEFYKLATIHNIQAVATVLNLIEKQSKEIEELNLENIELKQSKIIDKNSIPNQNNFYDCYNYISKEESKQKEKKAYIKGTNDAHELCNKKWEDKIKAKIEELENGNKNTFIRGEKILVLQSLLDKE